MVIYDKKIVKKNIASLEEVIRIHTKCMSKADLREVREAYTQYCDNLLSDKMNRDVRYMDTVDRLLSRLRWVNDWTGESELRKINKLLYFIRPFTNIPIQLFPVVNEEIEYDDE